MTLAAQNAIPADNGWKFHGCIPFCVFVSCSDVVVMLTIERLNSIHRETLAATKEKQSESQTLCLTNAAWKWLAE